MVGSNPARSPGNLDEALEGGKCIALNQCQPRHAVAADDPNFDVPAARRRRHDGYQRTLWEIDEACRLVWALEAVPKFKLHGLKWPNQLSISAIQAHQQPVCNRQVGGKHGASLNGQEHKCLFAACARAVLASDATSYH